MSYPELLQLEQLHHHWVAIAPSGHPGGLASLRSGAVVVDYDAEIDQLCARISASQKTSLTIIYCGDGARA